MGELKRSRDNRMFAGVLAGVSKQYGWDLGLIRLIYFLVALFSAGTIPVVAYVAAAVMIPEEDYEGPDIQN